MSGRLLRILVMTMLIQAVSTAESYGINLRDTANRADYVIVTPASYYPIAAKLAAFRHERNGFTTSIVDIDSVLAQFGKGTSPDTALKDFVQYTLNNWSDPKPEYFVLAGNINVIPSHPQPETITGLGMTSCDSVLMIDQWFVQASDGNGDVYVDACLGRLPAWDSSGLAIMVNKTIAYETDTAGAWCNRAISVADYREEDGDLFECDAGIILSYLDSLWTDTISVDVRCDSPDYLNSTGFVGLWSQGAAIITYCGHADPVQLSYSEYFTTDCVHSLSNGNRLPVCLLGACDLNFDNSPELSIPTHLLTHAGGGAVAVISSEGLMYEGIAFAFSTSMIRSMTQNPNTPIGKAYMEAMPSSWGLDLFERFNFLGDPALTVRHASGPDFVVTAPYLPQSFELAQNYPNPFNPGTTINYQLPMNSITTLKIYDVLGRVVATLVSEWQSRGAHSVTFSAPNLSSGVYLYRLQSGTYSDTKKMVLLR